MAGYSNYQQFPQMGSVMPPGMPMPQQRPPGLNPLGDASVGGSTAPAATPPGYSIPGSAAGTDPQGIGRPPEAFIESGRNAALRMLQGKGLNPYSPAIGVQALLNRADEVISSAFMRAINSGAYQSLLADPQAAQGYVNSALEAGLHNTPGVLTGRGEAQSALQRAGEIMNSVVHSGSGGPSEADNMLANILGDPGRLANMARDALFGTYGASGARALGAPWQDIPFWITEYQGNRLPGQPYDETQTALGLLLSGAFPRVRVGAQ